MVVEIFNKGRVFFRISNHRANHNRPLLSSPQSVFQSEYESETFVGEVSCTFTDMNEN